MSLRSVLPEAAFHGADDLAVRFCCSDSRLCEPGDLFVLLPGGDNDGADFVHEAARQGATAVLADHFDSRWNLPACVTSDVRAAHASLCQAMYENPSASLRTIGIAGSSGKTSTAMLLSAILEEAGYCPGVLGSLGYCDRNRMRHAPRTTPEAGELADWLYHMVDQACSHAVVELSSPALAESRANGVTLDVACVTNGLQDAPDDSLENGFAAKTKIFDHLSSNGLAVVNADDPGVAACLARLDGPVLTVGIDRQAEIMAEIVEQGLDGQTFYLIAGHESVPVRSSLIGTHNVYNCLVAAAVGLGYGLELTTIVRGIEQVTRVPGRLERLEHGQPFATFLDSADTPQRLTQALQTLRSVTSGRLICVTGTETDGDSRNQAAFVQAVAESADVSILTSDTVLTSDVIRAEELPSLENNEPQDDVIALDSRRSRTTPDRVEALGWALDEAQPGDCVLIIGSGREIIPDNEDENKNKNENENEAMFDDRGEVERLLQQRFPSQRPGRSAA
ncbi:MAG: UDP-N-acetylmuramyl-tripeptide synthetase [Planctomycetales bacterium]